MAPTATRPKTDPLADLAHREKALTKLREQARRDSRDFAAKVRRFRELDRERRGLIHREPGLVDHSHQPVDDKNAIADIDREVESLGDLAETKAKLDHADALVRRAEQGLHDFIAVHLAAILDGNRAVDQTATDELNEAIANAKEKAQAKLDLIRRLTAYTIAGNDGRDPRTIAGLDDAAAVLRDLDPWHFTTSIPEADDA